jgi:hypothetical protein
MTRDVRLFLGLGIATFLLLGSASVAQAQYGAPPPGYGYPPPPAGMYRQGLVLGVGVGVGGISASNCGDVCGIAGALELHIGGMINPRLAIMGDFWFNGRTVPNTDVSVVHSLYTVAAQYWATDNVWIKGGIGGANMNLSSNIDAFTYGDESGFGVMAAGGIEFLQMGTFALDGQLRLGHGFYSQGGDVNAWALMIGANWY